LVTIQREDLLEEVSEMDPLEVTAAMLCEVFPGHSKYRNPDFLDWEYRGSPSGQAIEANAEDEHGRTGHYAVVPQRWMVDGRVNRYALSLDSSVAERSRGMGLFSTLGNQVADQARSRGYAALIGLANAQATPGQIRNIGFELIRSLPVVIHLPAAVRGVRSFDVISPEALPDWLDGSGGAVTPGSGSWRIWDAAEVTRLRGLPVVVILKTFVRAAAREMSLSRLATAVCVRHRSPFAIYAGYNPRLRRSGIPVPVRLRPSPLNLIVKPLVADVPTSSLVPSCLEFWDFDAY
jgi:GNAT superfamily N-acetyltransferase